MEVMELEGVDAVKYLRGPDTVRDGALVNFSIQKINEQPFIELVFEKPVDHGLGIVKLELRDVQEFSYAYTIENPPDVIEFVKCLMTDEGEFYLSLDPYDEREDFVSEKDNDFFRSKSVLLTVIKKAVSP
jgi:hypothetical protein